MAFLSAVIGVRDSSGVRVDSPDSLGNYLPIVLKLGSDLTSSVTQSGGVSVVTINATGSVTSVTGTAPITSSGGATPAIGISAASGGAAGSMSAAHYTLVNNATDAATASTLVKRDGSSVTKLAALELGATPSTTLGQLRATAGNVLSAKIGPAGEDRTILSTDNEHFLLGSTYGNVVAQIANGVTKFRVLDPFVLGPTAVAAEFGSAQIDLYNLVKLYGGTATTATAKGHVGLDSTGRLTVFADGSEQVVPVMSDAGASAGVMHSGTGDPNVHRVLQGVSAAHLSATLPSSVTAGNLIVVMIQSETPGSIAGATISDTLGTTYTRIAYDDTGALGIAVFSGLAGGSGSCTITGTHGDNYARVTAIEAMGYTATAIDQDYGYSATSLSVTTTAVHQLVIGAVASYHSAVSYTPGSGFVGTAIGTDLDSSMIMTSRVAAAGPVTVAYSASATDNAPFFAAAFARTGAASVGSDGDWYLDTSDNSIWGPRSGGVYTRRGALS